MTSRVDPDPARLIEAHRRANEFYRCHLLDQPRALAYLRSRGIVAATAHAPPWTIGYAPRGWTSLRDHLRGQDFTDAELLAAGLVTTARDGNLIDVFRDRVMFPIRNRDRQVVAFTGRDLSGRADTPKYRNTAITAIYQKKTILYGMAEQLGGDVQPAAVMLVEGTADVNAVARLRQSLPASQYPDPYLAVATCGTALTAEQITLLAEAVPPGTPIVCAFDGDSGGNAAVDRSYRLLRDWPGPVEAMALPDGADPASLVAGGPAAALATFTAARTPLVDLVVAHRIAPHLARLQARLAELARFDRDPEWEATAIKLAAVHTVAPLVTEVAATDPAHAARLQVQLATQLELNPLTVFEAIYPPDDDTGPDPADQGDEQADQDRPPRPAIALGGAGFPHPSTVGHAYARVCPPHAPATTWVQHDPVSGHTAWVLAEGLADTAADRTAAQLAAEVAGRVAPLVGARQAVQIARVAVNAHFAQPSTAAQGNATIAVLTSFDGDRPSPGPNRFTVARAGDTRAYASTGHWFAQLTVDHTLREHPDSPDHRHRAGVRLLTQHPGEAAGPPDTYQQQVIAQATDPDWLARADLLNLATTWHTAQAHQRQYPPAANAADAVRQRLAQLYPQAFTDIDKAVAAGIPIGEAMRTAARTSPSLQRPTDIRRRAEDERLTASVRGGPIGVNRLDLPATRILLAGRALRDVNPATLRKAVDGQRPAAAATQIGQLGTAAAAVVVAPRPDAARNAVTPARLAAQDQAPTRPASTAPAPHRRRRSRTPSALPTASATC